MALETGTIFLPAVAFLVYQEVAGAGVLGHTDWLTNVLLIGTGIITVIPLLWFADAAQRIPLSMMGVIQYISPTLMFVLGIVAFHEPFNVHKLIGFALIWAALAVYSANGVRSARQRRHALPPVPEAPLPSR
jgi:chloramphenicol-sensitive protein RarD